MGVAAEHSNNDSRRRPIFIVGISIIRRTISSRRGYWLVLPADGSYCVHGVAHERVTTEVYRTYCSPSPHLLWTTLYALSF
jgi:hypothetical protein